MKKLMSKKGKLIIIREPRQTDVKKILEFFNKLIGEDTYILRFVEDKVTLAGEKDWLTKSLENVKNKEAILLEAYYKDQLVGQVEISRGQFP